MSKMSEIKKYKKLLSYMFSEKDFKRYFDIEGKILKYSELSRYNNIEELLPHDKDFKIILTETEPNTGHWCCLLRKDKKVIWFDSYSVPPDGELKFISRMMNKMLNQEVHQIHRLFKTCKQFGLVPDYNHYKYQAESDDICTCGRWVTWFVLMSNLNYSLKEMHEFMERQKFQTGKPLDILVCDYII